MRLPYNVRSKVNKCISREPSSLLIATTWELVDDIWRTEDRKFLIVKDNKYGLVIAEIINPCKEMKP